MRLSNYLSIFLTKYKDFFTIFFEKFAIINHHLMPCFVSCNILFLTPWNLTIKLKKNDTNGQGKKNFLIKK